MDSSVYDLTEIPQQSKSLSRRIYLLAFISLLMIGVLFSAFFIWASSAQTIVMIHGHGEIIPSYQAQVVVPFKEGIVENVYVREGDSVEAGQPLLSIGSVPEDAQFQEYRDSYLRALVEVVRLQALVEGKEFQVPEIVRKDAPLIAEEAIGTYNERKKIIENKKHILDQIILVQVHEGEGTQAAINQNKNLLAYVEQELSNMAPLIKDQLISQRDILDMKMDIVKLNGQITAGEAKLAVDKETHEQAKFELEQVLYNFKTEDRAQLLVAQAAFAEASRKIRAASHQGQMKEIRAPMKGIVREMKQIIVGSVLQPEERVLTIEPAKDTVFVKATIRARDEVFLELYQNSKVELAHYDLLEYGYLKGKVIKLSSEDGAEFGSNYQDHAVLLQADRRPLNGKSAQVETKEGMPVDVAIYAGDHTYLSYIFKPLVRRVQSYF